MGHEATVYGHIIGDGFKVNGRFQWIYDQNRAALDSLPEADDDYWPWLSRGSFALPADFPQGTYRRQVIHFGLSIKDDPGDRTIWEIWFSKFEELLRKMYWSKATVHLATDFEPDREFLYLPNESALEELFADPPTPVAEWTRTVHEIDIKNRRWYSIRR